MAKTRYIGKVKDGAALPFYAEPNNPHVLFFDKREEAYGFSNGVMILWANSSTKPSNHIGGIVTNRLVTGEYDYIDSEVFNAAFPLNKIVLKDELKAHASAVQITDTKPTPVSPFAEKFPSVANRYVGYLGKRHKTGTKAFANQYIIDTANYEFLYKDGTHKAYSTKWTKDKLQVYIDDGTYAYLTPEEFYIQFPDIAEKPAPVLTKYIGIKNEKGEYQPFGSDHYGFRYAFYMGDTAPLFLYADGRTITETGWTNARVKENLDSTFYGYLTQETFDKYFTKTKTVIAAPTPAPKIMANSFVIGKGKLYFNQTTKQVERVLTIQDGALIWTSRHKQEAKSYGKSTFRLATDAEVQNYLAEASANSN